MDSEGTNEVRRTDDVRQRYVPELRELRQGLGCTPERLREQKELHEGLRRRLQRQNKPVEIEECIKELKKLVIRLSDPDQRVPLLVALGFEEEHPGQTLRARRESYQAALERIKMRADIRTLQHREDRAIEAVAPWLDDDDSADIEVVTGPRLIRPSSSVAELYTLVQASAYYFSGTGVITRKDTSLWIKAHVANAEPYIPVAHQYLSEDRPNVISVYADYGCRITGHNESSNGAVVDTLEISKRLNPEDDPYILGYHALVESDKKSEPLVRWQPESSFALRAEFRLIFDPQMTPLRAWWFSVPNSIMAPIEPSQSEGRHLDIYDDGRYIFKVFEEELGANLHYGIAWIWR